MSPSAFARATASAGIRTIAPVKMLIGCGTRAWNASDWKFHISGQRFPLPR
jgi:hypothetical protein